MKELIGKTISNIFMDPDGGVIVFDTQDGYYKYFAEGDCCSSTWIEHIHGITNNLPFTVDEYKFIDLEEGWAPTRDHYTEEDSFYAEGLICCGKPEIKIEYRNASNGYYGGSLTFSGKSETLPYVNDNEPLQCIKEDF